MFALDIYTNSHAFFIEQGYVNFIKLQIFLKMLLTWGHNLETLHTNCVIILSQITYYFAESVS